jgi:CBS domain containing-hemolysin-like protein
MDDPLPGSCTGTGPAAGLAFLFAQTDSASVLEFLETALAVVVEWATNLDLVLVTLFILVLSALCSMTEAAFLSFTTLRAQSLAESENTMDRKAGRLRMDFDRPLAAIVILNNVANVTGTAMAGAVAQSHFETQLGTPASIAVGVFAALLTLLVILFGEIVPKTFGEKHRKTVVRVAAYPISGLMVVLTPIIWLVAKLQRPFSGAGLGHRTSEEEISLLTELGQEQGAIEPREGEFIQNVFPAEDIMIPRPEMVILDADQTVGRAAEELGKINRNRVPLYRGDRDHVVAILDRIDALLALAEDKDDLPLTDPSLSFKPYFIPESMRADRLLVRLQQRPEPMAIVVGEYGETLGLVTLEDVLEELVGDIVDEDDIDQGNGVLRIGPTEVLALGRAEIKDVNAHLEANLPNHRTVAGLVLDELGRIPKRNETFQAHGATFVISEVSDRAILKVQIRVVPPAADAENPGDESA